MICRTLHGYTREAAQKFLTEVAKQTRAFLSKSDSSAPAGARRFFLLTFSLRLMCQRKSGKRLSVCTDRCFCEGFSPLFSRKRRRERKSYQKESAVRAFARPAERRGYAPRLRRLLKKAGENFCLLRVSLVTPRSIPIFHVRFPSHLLKIALFCC